jgi:glyoxylase-like metal-dependent hydrolase (beta-lactamase superfamily II)/rhodanese-related sulfurtransferase
MTGRKREPHREIVRFTDRGLGNDSYLFVRGGAAVVVDPVRDISRYHAAAEERSTRVVAAVETHLHADFVSGARELATRGAEVYASAAGHVRFPHHPVGDGELVEIDGIFLKALATPGHTPEHLSFLVEDADPPVLFSGGALIPGGAARTDLLGPERTEQLARALFRTFREGLAHLPDETRIHPTHGAGSFCSSGGSHGDRSTTLGDERRNNPLFAASTEEEFVKKLLSGYGLFPSYFLRLRDVNRGGPLLLEDLPPLVKLSGPDFEKQVADGAWAVDVRSADRFGDAHVRGSVGISLRDSFPVWLGWVVPWQSRLVFVVDRATEAMDAAHRARSIGFEDIAGWAPFDELAETGIPLAQTEMIDAAELERRLDSSDPPVVLDVRRPVEVARGKLPGALAVEAGRIAEAIPQGLGGPLVAYCSSGSRATVAASLLERAGIGPVSVFPGGIREWRDSGRTLEAPPESGPVSAPSS